MNTEEMRDMMPEMMKKMCAGMTGGDKKDMLISMMGNMMQDSEGHESMMPEMMLKVMMPHCIKVMMPAISKDKRAELASNMASTLIEQASSDMSVDEKAAFVGKIVETIVVDTMRA